MTITREEFLKRLEKIYSEEKYVEEGLREQWYSFFNPYIWEHSIFVHKRHNIFYGNGRDKELYSFDELEQFLIDKGIK